MTRRLKWRNVLVLTVAVGLLAGIVATSDAQFGFVNKNKIRLGTKWFGQDVQVATTPGCRYRGEVYLYNDPCKVYEGQTEPGYPRGVLPNDWLTVVLPEAPDFQPPPNHPNNPYKPLVGWNTADWPKDAGFQDAVALGGLPVMWFVQNDFYVTPPGAPCHPMFAHISFCRKLKP